MVYLYFLHMFVEIVLLALTVWLLFKRRKLAVLTLAAYFFHPFVTESALKLLFNEILPRNSTKVGMHLETSLPKACLVVYSSDYNIRFFGLEERYISDVTKYERMLKLMKSSDKETVIIKPGEIDYSFIYRHTGFMHLIKLNYAYYFARIAELPLYLVPAPLLRWVVLRPVLYATQGTITATELALKRGFAVNIFGGFHQAHTFGGSKFCFYNDIWLAAWYLWENHPERAKRIMIIDLDARQGVGHERDKLYAPRGLSTYDNGLFILDAYNPSIFPHDEEARKAIDREVLLDASMDDAKYLKEVLKAVEESLDAFRPDFIFYNAGTNIIVDNKIDGFSLSSQGVVERDSRVITAVRQREISMVMLSSRGYKLTSPEMSQSPSSFSTLPRATPKRRSSRSRSPNGRVRPINPVSYK